MITFGVGHDIVMGDVKPRLGAVDDVTATASVVVKHLMSDACFVVVLAGPVSHKTCHNNRPSVSYLKITC